jgi:hypothetical protein
METNNYKTVGSKPLSEKEKLIIVGIILMVILVIVMLASGKTFVAQDDKEEDDQNIKTSNPEVQIELAFVIKKVGEDRLYEDFCSKTFHLQIAFALNDQEKCFMGLKKTRELYEAGFKPEALFSYATVIHTHLNEKLKPFLRAGAKPKFRAAINIAFHRKLINQEQKAFLHELRHLRNIVAHEPYVNFGNEITEMFLNSELNLIETTIV